MGGSLATLRRRPGAAASPNSGAGRRCGRSPPSRPRSLPGRTGNAPAAISPAWPHVAQSQGYLDIGALVRDQVARGASLAGISRRAGRDKDWLSRHLGDIDPAAAAVAHQRRPEQREARWLPALRRLGFPDVASYLHQRHIVQHQTINAIAAEAGLSHHAVAAALCRHGLTRTVHAAKRHAARQRAAQVAAGLGFDSIASYISNRRAVGSTWQAMSAESGQPPSWLRRHQTQSSPQARASPRSDSR